MASTRKRSEKKGSGVPVKAMIAAVEFLRGFTSADKATGRDAESTGRIIHFGPASTGGVMQALSAVTGACRRVDWALGTFAVSADRLAAALAVVDAQGEETMELRLDETQLAWSGGSARGRIAVGATVAFPPAPDGPRADVGPTFAAAVARASFAMARGEQWPMLRGVHWCEDGAFLASDGDRLVSVRATPPTPCPFTGGVTIPDHLLRSMRDMQPKQIAVDDSDIWLFDERTQAFGREYHAEFPYRKLAGILTDMSARAAAGEITRAAVVRDQPIRALLQSIVSAATPPLYAAVVAVTKSGLEVRCAREDGEARVELLAEVTGAVKPDAEYRINAQYLADAAGQGCDLYFSERALYAATDDRAFQHAVMLFA